MFKITTNPLYILFMNQPQCVNLADWWNENTISGRLFEIKYKRITIRYAYDHCYLIGSTLSYLDDVLVSVGSERVLVVSSLINWADRIISMGPVWDS